MLNSPFLIMVSHENLELVGEDPFKAEIDLRLRFMISETLI